MQIKDFMEVTGYRITEGSDFCWSCFGPSAYQLDSWNGEQDGYSVSIVFDRETQVVYQAHLYDYLHDRSYRWQNPVYSSDYEYEAKERGINPKEAYDDVNFVDLDVEADFLEKARAVVAGEDYDTRVQIEVEFDDDLMLAAMRMAHELDITFNQLVEKILGEKIEELKGESNE